MKARCSNPSEHDQAAARIDCSYILPLRLTDPDSVHEIMVELGTYLSQVASWCTEAIVVDGSPPAVFAENARYLSRPVRHVTPDPRHRSLMGKVTGVLTGLDLAEHEALVVADDDVRYERDEIKRVVGLLRDYDLVRPQNYFSPLPWHAVWDTARTLLNRATGADFPGTLGVRRSTLRAAGGYDGDVLFENLELIRTMEACGGRVASPLDLYVRRLPPSSAGFFGQRTRQAYDDFAIPGRMIVWLSILPSLAAAARHRRPLVPVGLAAASIALAEVGRRRAGGSAVFPASASAAAPAWVAERAVCAWLAVLQRVRFGGVRYGQSIIPTAAHSRRDLRRRHEHKERQASFRGTSAYGSSR